VVGAPRSLLIDTGLNHPECRAALDAGLKALGVQFSDLNVFITHMHSDHLSLATVMVTDQTTVYMENPTFHQAAL